MRSDPSLCSEVAIGVRIQYLFREIGDKQEKGNKTSHDLHREQYILSEAPTFQGMLSHDVLMEP